jgi:hypothetical protein
MGLKASSGMPAAISSGVAPTRLLPTRMWWSRKGLAGLQGLQPKADPAQLGGHGVDVHPVEATADHVVHRAQDLALPGKGQVAQGFEQVVVGQLRGGEGGRPIGKQRIGT